MIVDGSGIVGNAKVYKTSKEMQLEKENQKLREALKFYADPTNWQDTDILGSDGPAILDDEYEPEKHLTVGGKRARQCLEEIDKGKQ